MNNNIKSSFDTFNPTDEQKMRMLKNIESKAYANNVFDFKKIYIPMACAVAAAFIFMVTGGPVKDEAHNISTNQIVSVTPDVKVKTQPQNESEQIENNIEVPTAPVSQDGNANISQTKVEVKSEINTETDQKQDGFKQVFESVDKNNVTNSITNKTNDADKSNNMPKEDINQNIDDNTSVEDDSIQNQQTDDIQMVQLVLNDVPQSDTSPMARDSLQTASEEHQNSEVEYKDVTYTEFCDEIGYDVASDVKVPDDMQNITQNENRIQADSDMEWDVTFIGENARCININASTDMSKNDEYINGDYNKTDINGNEAVVFYDENYTAYMNTQNANYKITAIDVNENEFTDVLTSLK